MNDTETFLEEQGEGEVAGMTDAELVKALDYELEHAAGSSNAEIDGSRQAAYDYYWGRLPVPRRGPGRAKIVSTDLMDAVEATMAEIMPSIGSDQLAQFLPYGPTDEAQADQESRVVNHVVMGVGGGFMAFTQAIKEALLRRLGVIKVHWEEKREVSYETHRDIPLEQVPLLRQPRDELETVTLSGVEYDEETQTMPDGTPHASISGLTVEIKRERQVRRPRVQAVSVDELYVNADHNSLDYDEARLVAQISIVSASDLVALGVPRDVVDSLPAYNQDATSTAKNRRKRAQAESEYETGHKSTKPILAAECYYRIDRDGDGIAELRRVILARTAGSQSTLLFDEPWDVQPFAVGAGYVAPFSWEGISLHDRLRNVQDTKTDLIRQILDVGTRSLQGRTGVVERQVNMKDMQSSILGGAVRMKQAGAAFPFPDPQLPPASFSLLETMDKMRREKGGAAIDTAAQAQQVAHDTAHGLERTMTAIEQVNAMVARNIAETLIVQVYRKMHRLLRKHWPGVITARAGGNWLQQVPGGWKERDDVAVVVGMTSGERARQAQALTMTLDRQMAAMQNGQDGVLVALPNVYNALTDLGRVLGLQSPEQYWVDPASPEGQQAAQQKAAQAQAAQQAQMQAAQAQAALLKEVEGIRAQAQVLVKKIDQEIQDKKIDAEYADKRLKLVELNAKYDNEPVPDTMAQVEEQNDKAALSSAMRGAQAGEAMAREEVA